MLEEPRTAFSDYYQMKMAMPVKTPQMLKAPDLAATFCQSFGQSQGLYTDNYLKQLDI